MNLPGQVGAIGDAVDNSGGKILGYALILAGVGTLAMALLELIKGLFKLRRIYNRWAVREWMANQHRTLLRLPLSLMPNPSDSSNVVLAELELLAVGGHDFADALYDQPIEKLMGQLQAAVNVAMDFPDQYQTLYKFITSVPKSYKQRGVGEGTASDAERWHDHVLRIQQRGPTASETLGPDDTEQQAAQARTRLVNLVTRKLDAFQIETQYFWERLNQWSSVAIGIAVFYISGYAATHKPDEAIVFDPLLLLLSVPAGVIAPFAKDLASSLSSFGKP
jgi:hypothetical protein